MRRSHSGGNGPSTESIGSGSSGALRPEAAAARERVGVVFVEAESPRAGRGGVALPVGVSLLAAADEMLDAGCDAVLVDTGMGGRGALMAELDRDDVEDVEGSAG